MKQLLPKLTERLKQFYPTASKIPVEPFTSIVPKSVDGDETIVHSYFWPRVGQFLRPKDVIITETGMNMYFVSFEE
jgi:pyruvate decarboxylase